MTQKIRESLWFCAGFALAGILALSYPGVRYVPLGVAFGLLCFGCGVLLSTLVGLWRQQQEYRNKQKELLCEFLVAKKNLEEAKSDFEQEKEKFEDEKEVFEALKANWEEEHPDESESRE